MRRSAHPGSPPPPAASAGPGARFEGVHFHEHQPGGRTLEIEVAKLHYDMTSGRVALEGVTADLPGTSRSGARIRADRGLYLVGSEHLSLEGNVHMETRDGYRIDTRSLEVDHHPMMATAPGEVAVHGPGGWMRGRGMRMDFDRETLALEGGVEGMVRSDRAGVAPSGGGRDGGL